MKNHNAFIERLASMSQEELVTALKNTAEGDKTHRAEWFAQTNNSRNEAMEIYFENADAYQAALTELLSDPLVTSGSVVQMIAARVVVLVQKVCGALTEVLWQDNFEPVGAGEASIAIQEIPICVPGIAEENVHLSIRWDEDDGVTRFSVEGANAYKLLVWNQRFIVSFEDGSNTNFVLNTETVYFDLPYHESKIQAVTVALDTVNHKE